MPTTQNLRSASRGGAQIKSGRRANARPDEWWKSKAYADPCRSRLAGEKRRGNAFIQTVRVIVDVHRWQASSYNFKPCEPNPV
ncbi:hypothetical protein EMIT0P44_110156 [Pseudomonas sp. IT-P44]